jgi:hypothetical protein
LQTAHHRSVHPCASRVEASASLVQQTGQDFYVPVAGGAGEDDASYGVARLEVGTVRGEQGRDGGMVGTAGLVESERTLVSGD